MTLIEHLAELRMRLIRSVLAITVGAVLVFAFYDPVLTFLREPYDHVCRNTPTPGKTSSSHPLQPRDLGWRVTADWFRPPDVSGRSGASHPPCTLKKGTLSPSVVLSGRRVLASSFAQG
jgi:hypothetical protein